MVERAMRRWPVRRSVGRLKKTIERLAAEAPTLEWFDAAAGAFLTDSERRSSTPASKRPSIRLARLYIRHFRREFIRERQFLEMASRQALMGAAG